jgi:hypothetical protein
LIHRQTDNPLGNYHDRPHHHSLRYCWLQNQPPDRSHAGFVSHFINLLTGNIMKKKTPSIKTLSSVFTDAVQAKKILQMTRNELLQTPAGSARNAECYNPPKTYDLRLTVLNAIELGLHGVEWFENDKGVYDGALYLNAGDIYAPTLIYWNSSYRVQSVGDFIETMEKQGVKFK